MVYVGKIHKNIFIGIFGLFFPLPNMISITRDYILPLIQKDILIIPGGKIILLILSLVIFIASFIWVKEVVEDFERTSRFMNQSKCNEFLVKTTAIVFMAMLSGLLANKIIFT